MSLESQFSLSSTPNNEEVGLGGNPRNSHFNLDFYINNNNNNNNNNIIIILLYQLLPYGPLNCLRTKEQS